MAALGAAGCGSSGGASPAGRVALIASAPSALADAPVALKLRGLRAHERVTLRASWKAADGHIWASRTPVRADERGDADLRGVDGTRFLWTMRPVGAGARRMLTFAAPLDGPSHVSLALVGRGRTLARATLTRRFAPDTVRVRRLTLRKDGLVGHLLTPPGAARHPAAVLFGGSEGGERAIGQATMLAAHGYPTLSLAYFKEPGLPRYLKDVPLEYFARAVRLLRRQPDVDPARVITIGTSRGGEASLLVASTYPRLVHGAVGLVPSANANGSYGAPHPGRAWTYRGRPVPEVQIPVERITGPVLIAGGGLDAVWDSATAVQLIEQRLTDDHFRFAHTAASYANAGHAIGTAIPYLPRRVNERLYGGDPRADAAARANLWPRILRLLATLQPHHA